MNLKLVGLFKKNQIPLNSFGLYKFCPPEQLWMHLNNCVRRKGGFPFLITFPVCQGSRIVRNTNFDKFFLREKRLKKYVLGKQVWGFLCIQVNGIISEKMILFDHCCQKQCRLEESTIVGGLRSTDFRENAN